MGGQADAEGDGQDCHYGESRRPDQHAHAVPQIRDEGVHEGYYGLTLLKDSVRRDERLGAHVAKPRAPLGRSGFVVGVSQPTGRRLVNRQTQASCRAIGS